MPVINRTAKGASPGEEGPAVLAARLLRQCVMFGDLSDADALALGSTTTRRRYAAGETVFYAGGPGDSMIAIIDGEIRISRSSPEGDEMILIDLGRGDIVGEIAVLDGKGRSADATARTNCDVIVLERRHLIAFLESRPLLCIQLMALLCGKLRLADERSSDFAFLSLSARLAKALLARSSPPVAGKHQGRVSLTQGELARIAGGTRSNVNRQLREWQRRSLVQMDRGWILVLDREGLAKLCTGP